jgi:hypothetical protein
MKLLVKGLLAAGAAAMVLATAGCHCCDQPTALDKFGNPIYTGHHCNWFHHNNCGYDAVAVAEPAPCDRPMMMKAKRKKKCRAEMEQ